MPDNDEVKKFVRENDGKPVKKGRKNPHEKPENPEKPENMNPQRNSDSQSDD